ncbi:MAG: 4Fe-4S binding protein [candidate division KSB1 bacterium]|nr:4Fe-4S binding protein [candidate division KSB1 bacterium]
MQRRFAGKLLYDPSLCDYCGTCVGVCPHDAIELEESEFSVIEERCTRCLACVFVCPVRAMEAVDEEQL